MLNELKTVADSLARAGIVPPTPSPLFKKNKKQAGVRLHLARNGSIASVNVMDAEQVAALFRYEKAAGNSFPTFNCGPCRELSGDVLTQLRQSVRRESEGAKRLRLIRAAWEEGAAPRLNTDKLTKCLKTVPSETEPFWGGAAGEFAAIAKLIDRLQGSKWTPETFMNDLSAACFAALEQHAQENECVGVLTTLLFEKSVPLLWDLDDLGPNERAVTSSEMRHYLNERLVERASAPQNVGEVTDSLSGKMGKPVSRFPQPTLPVLGPSPLFSSPVATYCQDRYGLTEGEVFPTIQDTSERLDSAVQWLTAKEREGITWAKLPHDSKDAVCLLLAYVEEMPAFQGPFAAQFASQGDPAVVENRFEKQAGKVVEMLDKLRPKLPTGTVRLIVLGKPDPGRRNVLFSDRFSTEQFAAAVRLWSDVQLAAPPFHTVWPLAKKQSVPLDSYVIHPGDLVRAINTTWLRGIAERKHVPGARMHEVYSLLLGRRDEQRREAHSLLPRAVRNWSEALRVIGGHRHANRFKEVSAEASFFAREAVSALTLLLHYSEPEGTNRMNDTAHQLGRALAWADTLHRYYCELVRQGSLPNDLVGSSLLAVAATQPASALARLLERAKPYMSWAQTYGGERAGLARWALRGLKESLSAIPREQLGKRFTDMDRAELLLGYASDLKPQTDDQSSNPGE